MSTHGYGWFDFLARSAYTYFPQRGDPMEVSLSMVPQNHPLMPPKNLEAEASGLLDRMLSVFHENSR